MSTYILFQQPCYKPTGKFSPITKEVKNQPQMQPACNKNFIEYI